MIRSVVLFQQLNTKPNNSMAKFRSCSSFSCKNPNFIAVVFTLLLSFALLIYEYFLVERKVTTFMFIICFFYLLSLWSYTASVACNPGSVPVYYGLYSQDVSGQRKYCLLCHNFKPERSHHCSKCKQCVLNMDHHCPWINNCVGFDNRKYFVLFITYLLISLTLALIWMAIVLIKQITTKTFETNIHTVLKLLLFVKYSFLEVTLGIFTVTHYRYVLTNLTTIEQMVMDRKKKAVTDKQVNFINIEHNQYDISPYYNFTQVFGDNPFYWMIPIASETPLRGAGIRWDKNRDLANHSNQQQKYSMR